MVQPLRKTILVALATSLFVTLGMLVIHSEDDNQRKMLEEALLKFWNGQQMGTVKANVSGFYGPAISVSRTQGQADANRTHDTDPIVSHRDVMERRKHLISSGCSRLPHQSPRTFAILYNPKFKLYYCPIEKVASTFWRRFMYQLHHTHPVRSPFDVSIMKGLVGARRLELPADKKQGAGLNEILKESTKFLFVRDSYSRIFSAYVDKLLAPNPMFWKMWGTPAILRYRRNHHPVVGNSAYGYDVTFEEFVKYVIDVASKNDGHVMPINKGCTPCAVNYTVIGKIESFVDDTEFLYEYLNLNKTGLRVDTLKKETALDAMADSATDALSMGWVKPAMKCITKEAILQRIWRKNQIRGFVSWRESMNLSSTEIKYMKSKQFINLLNEANKKSTNKDELKIQKAQAFREAFATLGSDLLSRIKEIYSDDFKLFGYSEEPSWLRDLQTRKNDSIDTKSFDYSQSWDLSKVVS